MTLCQFTETLKPDQEGKSEYACPNCDRPLVLRSNLKFVRECIGRGPGAELFLLLHLFKLRPTGDCKCMEHVDQMNQWGVQGCREHFAVIKKWLQDSYKQKVSWVKAFQGAIKAVGQLDWFSYIDPIGSLIEEAINRAEKKLLG